MGKWDYEDGDLVIIKNPDKSDKPSAQDLFTKDKASWETLIKTVKDPGLKKHMQEALAEGNEDLLNTLITEIKD